MNPNKELLWGLWVRPGSRVQGFRAQGLRFKASFSLGLEGLGLEV